MSQSFSDDPQPEFFDYKHVGGRFLGLIGMAVLAFVVVIVGAFFDTRQFAFSYLFAYTFFDDGYTSFNKPTVFVLLQWWLKHPYRTGVDVAQAIPFFAVGFSFNQDFVF